MAPKYKDSIISRKNEWDIPKMKEKNKLGLIWEGGDIGL